MCSHARACSLSLALSLSLARARSLSLSLSHTHSSPDDGTAVRLPSLHANAAEIVRDFPLDMRLVDASDYIYASPWNMEPVQRLVQV